MTTAKIIFDMMLLANCHGDDTPEDAISRLRECRDALGSVLIAHDSDDDEYIKWAWDRAEKALIAVDKHPYQESDEAKQEYAKAAIAKAEGR